MIYIRSFAWFYDTPFSPYRIKRRTSICTTNIDLFNYNKTAALKQERRNSVFAEPYAFR